jgi:hypothetical protein
MIMSKSARGACLTASVDRGPDALRAPLKRYVILELETASQEPPSPDNRWYTLKSAIQDCAGSGDVR